MKMFKGFVLPLVLLGVSSGALAYHAAVTNKTPFKILVSTRQYAGTHAAGKATEIAAGQTVFVPGTAANGIEGLYVSVYLPGGSGATLLAPVSAAYPLGNTKNSAFQSNTSNALRNTKAVVGCEPVMKTIQKSYMGELITVNEIQQLKFYVVSDISNIEDANNAISYSTSSSK